MKITQVRDEDLLAAYSPEEIQTARSLYREAAIKSMELQGKVPDFILNIENFPLGQDTRSHLAHLMYFENLFSGRKLRILDLSCGGGDFTRLATHRGHSVLATESDIAKDTISASDIVDMPSFRSYYRHRMRRVNTVKAVNLYIHPRDIESLVLPGGIDLIYVNQCALHMPHPCGAGFWQEREWRCFLRACERALAPNGMMFLLMGDPSYLELGAYLKRFFRHYFLINGADDRYWTTLVMDSSNRSRVGEPLADSELPESTDLYKVIGNAVDVMPPVPRI